MRLVVVFIIFCAAVLSESWDGVARVVVVGDVHGDYAQFTSVLRQAGLLEPSKDKWAGGKAHLVQLGDVPDRGPDTRRILDLLMELEKQARKAGGRVHPLIGNHEAMNMYGDLRYATPEEFTSFRRSNSEEIRSEYWRVHSAELQQKGEGARLTPEYRSEWEKKVPPGFVEHRIEFSPDGKYGGWIRKHNAIIRINDSLYLHGGISPKYGGKSITEINEQIRRELGNFELLEGGMVVDPEGPLWYRGLATAPESELEQHLSSVLRFHGVKRIVLGHTRTMGAVMPRFEGRVILADVGLSSALGGRVACLVIEGEKLTAIHRGFALRLPTSSSGILEYLKEVAAHDPEPSPILAAVQAMESSEIVAGPLATADDEPGSRRR